MNAKRDNRRVGLWLSALTLLLVSFACYGTESGYTEEQIYTGRPDSSREMPFGHIGVTGVMVRINRDVTIKVEKTVSGSPAHDKFEKGEIITGINGVSLKGKNPFVTLGNALTNAEATNGRMIFDVTAADGKSKRKETVRIPVLGAYSKTWPLNCNKSKMIIEQAAEFFAHRTNCETVYNGRGIPGALACLFLLAQLPAGHGQEAAVRRIIASQFERFVQRPDRRLRSARRHEPGRPARGQRRHVPLSRLPPR